MTSDEIRTYQGRVILAAGIIEAVAAALIIGALVASAPQVNDLMKASSQHTHASVIE
jgi:hypothetical protein